MAKQDVFWNSNEVLVGRTDELLQMERAFFTDGQSPRPIVVTGPAGVGKSALIAAFSKLHRERFPGGHVQIRAMDLASHDRALISHIVESLKLARSIEDDEDALRERLQSIPTLIQIDGIDTLTAVPIGRLSKRLRGCFVVWSGRFERLRIGMDDESIRLAPLDDAAAHELLSVVHLPAANEEETLARQTLIQAAHGLPLLLRMIAGFLRAGLDASKLVSALSTVQGDEGKPPSSGKPIRKTLAVLVEQGLDRIREVHGAEHTWPIDALRQMGQVPPSGLGKSLGAAAVGITEDEFERLMNSAEQVGLVASVPSIDAVKSNRWHVHPMIAEILRKDEHRDTVITRMTNWFVQKMSVRQTYSDVNAEQIALVWWLEELPEADWDRVAETAQYYVRHSHVPMVWFMFAGRALRRELGAPQQFPTLHIVAQVMLQIGEIAEATTLLDGLVGLAMASGDKRSEVHARLLAADIERAMGRTAESTRILRDDVIPLLTNASDKFVVADKLAGLLEHDGYYDTALSIRTSLAEHFLATGENAERAAVMAGIANVLHLQGKNAQALAILDEVVPVLASQSTPSNLSATLGLRGAILIELGRFEEGLGIFQNSVLPLAMKVGDVRLEAQSWASIATAYEAMNRHPEAFDIRSNEVLPLLRKFQDARAVANEQFAIGRNLEAQGEDERALPIYLNDVEPAFDKLELPANVAKLKYVIMRLYERLDQPNVVLERANELVVLFGKNGDERGRAIAYSMLADAQRSLGDVAGSIQTFQTLAWPTIRDIDQPREQGIVLAQWARSLAANGHYDDAMTKLNRALDLIDTASLDLPNLRAFKGRLHRCRNRASDTAEARVTISQAVAEAERMHHPKIDRLRRLLQNPVLERIEIKNFKGIRDLAIDFTHPSELGGQWTCIFGINGAGKSSILQAISLVLLGDESARDARMDQLKRMCRRQGDQLHDAEIHAIVRIGNEQRKLSLYISNEHGIYDDPYRARLAEFDKMRAFWRERAKEHVLLAYGPGRNLSERFNPKPLGEYHRQATLFDPLAPIASAEALLREENHVKRIYPLLRQLLVRILHETPITLDPDRSALRFKMGNARLEATDLPDGFRATIAWLADLCATWVEKSPDAAKENVPSAIRGIVLLDEIDLHLYPELQRVLVPRLRLALPEVQWIVTTHSPLVLSAFDKSEIKPIRWTDEGGVGLGEPLDRQILGYTANEVYEHVMGVKPRSEALDVNFGDSPEDKARKNLILAQSPSTSEAEALANRDYRRKLLEQRRQRADDEKKAANS